MLYQILLNQTLKISGIELACQLKDAMDAEFFILVSLHVTVIDVLTILCELV